MTKDFQLPEPRYFASMAADGHVNHTPYYDAQDLQTYAAAQVQSTLSRLPAPEVRELTWYDGVPPFPQNQEWFIAQTVDGGSIVLRALEQPHSYDYTTRDHTYLKANRILKWMQFPGCEYLPPSTPQPAKESVGGQVAKVIDAAKRAIAAAHDQLQNKPFPIKYAAPFHELAQLSNALDALESATPTKDVPRPGYWSPENLAALMPKHVPAPADSVNAGLVDALEMAEKCISSIIEYTQDGFDEAPRPLTEWDYCADQTATQARAALASAKAQQAVRVPLTDDERAELGRLHALVNSPELHSFADGVVLEASHQRERWGSEHDAGKAPADWFWLVGYLAGKALHAQTGGNTEKALHHTISTAAALANWHASISEEHTGMRPGIDPAAHGITGAASTVREGNDI